MTKKSLLWISLSPLAVLSPALIVACENNTSTNDKPGNNPGDNPGPQPITGQQTIAKTNLTAQSLDLNGTLSDAKSLINEEWILTNKDKLLDGGTNLFTSANDLVTDSVMFNSDETDTEITTGILNFSLKAGKSFGNDSKPTLQPTNFSIKITGFVKPTSMDLEKAKNKYLQYLDGLKYDFHAIKASEYKINQLANFGTRNNFGFKTEIQLDTDNGSSGYNDQTGEIFIKISLKRKNNEVETFKKTIGGFKTEIQENAENSDSNLNPKLMFNESFQFTNPSGTINVTTKNPNIDPKTIKSEEDLLNLISIEPNANSKQGQNDENTILQKALPEGYELKFIEESIKPNASWGKTFNEIQAGVQLVKKDGTAASSIYKLVVDGFTENKTKDVLEEWADFFEVGESPLKTRENEYSNDKATSVTSAAELKQQINLATDNGYQNDLLNRGLTFELDESVNPSEQNDDTGSLKAQFIFKWKDGDANLTVKKIITLYGFQLNS